MPPVSTAERRYLLNRLNGIAKTQLDALWDQALDAEDFAKAVIEAFPILVDRYRELAGQLAATWFEDADPESDYIAKVAPPPPDEKLANSADWALGATGRDGLDRLAGTMQRTIYDGARATILLNVVATRGSWIREAEADACDFCQELEGEYSVEDSAGFEAHDHCQCMAVESR